MTRDDVIGWAREVGIEVHDFKQVARFGMDALIGADSTEKLQRMCELAAAAEREACARICEKVVSVSAVSYETGSACATAIRARGSA